MPWEERKWGYKKDIHWQKLTLYGDRCQRTPKGQSKMDNPEILATMGTQDDEYKCVGHDYGQKI